MKNKESYKFLLQCNYIQGNLVPSFDFVYKVIDTVNYHNWMSQSIEYEYILAEKVPNNLEGKVIPVGSVEFVNDFIDTYNHNKVVPLNIPASLDKHLKRRLYRYQSISDIESLLNKYDKLFIKEQYKIKGYTNIITEVTKDIPNSLYIVSEYIDIVSEFRCFIFNRPYRDSIVDIKQYSGQKVHDLPFKV